MPALIPSRGVDKWPNQELSELHKAERTRLEAIQKADRLHPEISECQVPMVQRFLSLESR